MAYRAEDLMREKCEEICRETTDGKLFAEIVASFGSEADEIIADIICGKTADSAIQDMFMK